MRRCWTACSFVLLFLVGSMSGFASADTRLTVTIGATATIVDGGQAAVLPVGVACGPRSVEVLEAFVYITQDDVTSQFAGIPVQCVNRPRTYDVVVRATSGQLFHAGTASASAFVLLQNRRNQTTSASPSRSIVLA
jgi:hypothetical protein